MGSKIEQILLTIGSINEICRYQPYRACLELPEESNCESQSLPKNHPGFEDSFSKRMGPIATWTHKMPYLQYKSAVQVLYISEIGYIPQLVKFVFHSVTGASLVYLWERIHTPINEICVSFCNHCFLPFVSGECCACWSHCIITVEWLIYCIISMPKTNFIKYVFRSSGEKSQIHLIWIF